MEKPQISLLMPIHNNEATLSDCLESILAQTYPNFELVVIDDGSTDPSKMILEEYAGKDKRVNLLCHAHQGIVAALNLGLSQCQGKYIARMDGDDRMHSQRLEKQLQFMEKQAEVGLIGCLVEGIPTTTAYQQWSNSLITNEAIKEEIFVESPIMHPTFFGKREIFEKLEGYRHHPWAEDYDFLLRAYQQQIRFGKVDQFLVQKKDSPTRLSRIDWKYKRPAMFHAKLHYFRQCGFLDQKKGVIIAGTGPSGRKIAAICQEMAITVLGFMDNRPGPPERTVMGLPAWGMTQSLPSAVLEICQEAFILLAIGDKKGREQLISLLRNASPPPDFIRFL